LTEATSSSEVDKQLSDSQEGNDLFSAEGYTVGIICALYIELFAMRMLFGSHHMNVRIANEDSNHYIFGCIVKHNVVLVCLPSGVCGTNSAAGIASNM
jgi:hypothetical protein